VVKWKRLGGNANTEGGNTKLNSENARRVGQRESGELKMKSAGEVVICGASVRVRAGNGRGSEEDKSGIIQKSCRVWNKGTPGAVDREIRR